MAVSIDTKKAHLTRVHGQITAIYTWVNDERALVLAATHRPGNAFVSGAPLYVIREPNIWAYFDDPKKLSASAQKAAEVLGLGDSAVFKIADIIVDGAEDLIRMPSAPPQTEFYKGSFGQAILSANGVPIAAEDIRIEKQTGVQYA